MHLQSTLDILFSHAHFGKSFSLRTVIEKHKDLHFLVVMYFNYYSGMRIAACHLYVRSLPVGVDTGFDSSIRDFQSSVQEHKKLQVAFQFTFADGCSSLKRVAVRTILSIIFRWLFGKKTVLLNKGLRERLSCPRKLLHIAPAHGLHRFFFLTLLSVGKFHSHLSPSHCHCSLLPPTSALHIQQPAEELHCYYCPS